MHAYFRTVNYDEFTSRYDSQFSADKGEFALNLTALIDIRCLHESRKHVVRNAQKFDSGKNAQHIPHSIHAI